MTISNSLVLVDNGYGTIGAALATGDTTLTFTTGHGARFPAVASGQMLSCCILNSNNVLEEIQITLHTAGSDTATMVRGANGTTAKAWNAGDRIEARVSSDVLKRLQVEALKGITLSTADAGATYTGSISPTGYGLVTGLVYALNAATSNSGATPTINLSSLGAITVKLNGGGSLAAAQMPANGLYAFDGTNLFLLNPKFPQPTRTVLTSGSGTYTTPTGATRLNVRMVGGGSGGTGSGPSAGAGGVGGDTTFGTLTAHGGASNSYSGNANAGATATGGDINITGATGGNPIFGATVTNAGPSGAGGASPFGGAGGSVQSANGNAASANSGSGGSGAGGNTNANVQGGTGGNAGAYCEKLFAPPSATYTYGVGASGSAGSPGTGGSSGGAGGSGIIIVDEYYN